MANALIIPEAAQVPAYALNPELAKQMNESAAAGLSTGMPARIKMSGKQFVLVDGNGVENPVKAGEMFTADDNNAYLPIVILNAKKTLSKTWYSAAYNPNEEGQAPDCFSNDALTPDASIENPQCSSCANCPQNAFGSGRDQNGAATKGKACTDTKILAVFCKGSVYKLKVTPASLKNCGLYVKELTARGIPLGNVKTLLGFDESSSFPVLTFSFGGFLPESSLPQLANLSQSAETIDIVNETMQVSSKALPEQPAAKPAPKKAEPAKADDLGLDAPAKAEPAKEPEVVTAEAATNDLAAALGL